MEEKTELRILFYFTFVYMLFFVVFSVINKNYEFVYYIIVLSILMFIIILYHKKMHLSATIISGLIVLGAMHLAGGILKIKNVRLYDIWLIPNLFRYDNLVHLFGTFIATFVVYSLLKPHLDIKLKHHKVLLYILMVLITMGLSVMNELLEFGAVVFLNAAEQVGDYMNNALDLVFNMIGSLIACVFVLRYHKNITEG